ncbi:MAG: hypothetical protein GX650_02310 [Clostridiales bacterium]|nr:hypothetical protein [Clostridiales bacterium]
MDYSAANAGLWNVFVYLGVIAGLLLLGNVLNRKVAVVRNSLLPVSALAGFLLLIIRNTGLFDVPADTLDMITYHGIALGFIALSLRTVKDSRGGAYAFKSGALIVSTYLMQALVGLFISVVLAYTFMPGLFKASGILLPMAYGQGPGQANNVGSTYEALGFIGGRSFGLSLAAAGYLSACLVGLWYTRYLVKNKGYVIRTHDYVSGSITVDTFEDENEVPIAESVDRLSTQVALVLLTYLLTYGVTLGISSLVEAVAPGFAKTLSPLLWGFNFITGSLVAMGISGILKALRKNKVMTRQYQNNYLLNRISGLCFDLMIVAGIAAIDIGDLKGLWTPFLLMAVLGAITTYYFVKKLCYVLTPDFREESFVAMYGMLTGTISSGILLLRQIDPELKTPAADQLVIGSGTAILFGAPMLLLIGFAPQSTGMLFLTIALCALYMAVLVAYILGWRPARRKAQKSE